MKSIIITKRTPYVGQRLDWCGGELWQYRTLGQGRKAILRGAFTFTPENAELARHVAIDLGAGIEEI